MIVEEVRNSVSQEGACVASSPGHHIANDVISSRDCEQILDALERLPAQSGRAGMRRLMQYPSIRSIALDTRLTDLAQRLSGRPMTPYKATLFSKTSKANWLVAWHQDTALPIETFIDGAGWSGRSIKSDLLYAQAPAAVLEKIVALRVHLDASTSMNGPLRIIPGSHSCGILSDARIRELVRRSIAVQCVVDRGGVIAMSPLLLHASSKLKSDLPRRVLHIEYAESLQLEDGVKLCVS